MSEPLTVYSAWVVTEWWPWSGFSMNDTIYLSKEEAEKAAADSRATIVKMRNDVDVRVQTLDDAIYELRQQARLEGEASERERHDSY